MGETLKRRLQQSRFENPVQEALLNVLVAASFLEERLAAALVEHELTTPQYNVLRILRGNPDGYARCEIAARAIQRAPDLTRLIDRLEKRGLVERGRSDIDRRRSVTRITRRGLDMLERVAPAMRAAHRELAARLPDRDARELSRLCEQLYGEEA